MTNHLLRSPALAFALLLAACGGSDPPAAANGTPTAESLARSNFSAVVSFGDSLSDVGTYTPATQIPGSDPPVYLGGRFTTNSATARIWVEDVAAALGLVVTPAAVGFGDPTQTVYCPAAARGLGNTCTAYGQGGARVTDANGIRHNAGALTVPIRQQIANHLQRFSGFRPGDLILVWAGANDLLWEVEQDPAVNPDSFVIKLFQIEAQLQAGAIGPDQANALLAAAQAASLAHLQQAAQELAGYVRSEIVAKGGRHVAVLNLPDPVSTPEGAGIAAASPLLGATLTAFSAAFNQALADGLAGQPVKMIDVRRLIADVVARPAAYEMDNASVPACDPVKMSRITGGTVTDGFSLFCNATRKVDYNGLRPDANVKTWFFADGNHPTTGGYKVISDKVIREMRSFGWLRRAAEATREAG